MVTHNFRFLMLLAWLFLQQFYCYTHDSHFIHAKLLPATWRKKYATKKKKRISHQIKVKHDDASFSDSISLTRQTDRQTGRQAYGTIKRHKNTCTTSTALLMHIKLQCCQLPAPFVNSFL